MFFLEWLKLNLVFFHYFPAVHLNFQLPNFFFLNINRPTIILLSPSDYVIQFLTQSDNTTVKIALAVDEYTVNFYKNEMKQENIKWNRLENVLLWRTFDAFTFKGSSFSYRMLNKVINDLIPTGIMNLLIEKYYTKKWTYLKVEKLPKVLDVDDLAFGFNIWLGFCGISGVSFLLEMISRLKIFKFTIFMNTQSNNVKIWKYKSAKVHPSSNYVQSRHEELSAELIKKFRIHK